MITVQFEKISDTAAYPRRHSKDAACYDLYAAEGHGIWMGRTVAIPTGLRVRIPKGYALEILPRSGKALEGLQVANAPGIIDADYRGEIKLIMYNAGPISATVRVGDRIAQCRLVPVQDVNFEEVDSIDPNETERGEGGLGHTGTV